MSQNLNEIAAMALIGEFVSVKELLTAAMKGFAEDEDIKSQENAACTYIGHDEINRLLKEVDDFIEFKCLTSVYLITDRFGRKNRIAQNWRDGEHNG